MVTAMPKYQGRRMRGDARKKMQEEEDAHEHDDARAGANPVNAGAMDVATRR
jgi:hypothetical protein